MEDLTMETLANADRNRLLAVIEDLMQNRDDLEARRFIESKLAHFSNVSRYGDEDNLETWGSRVLEELAEVFNIIHGSLYISDSDRNNDEPPLQLAAAYSFNAEYLQKEVAYGEGIIGQAVKTRRPVKVLGSEIKVRFETSMADVAPRALMIYPLIFNYQVQGLLEFSTQRELSDKLQQLMELLAENLAANMLTIRSQEQMRGLFSEMQQRSEELQAQEEEMRQNLEELEATQEEMRRAQEGLEDFRVFITNIIDSTPTMFIGTDGEGTIKYWNKAAAQLLGYSAEEMIDQQTPAIFHDLAEIESEQKRLSEAYEAEIPLGFEVFKFLPYQGKVYEREWTYIHKDGTRFPVMLTISAWRNSSGEYAGLLGVARDLRKDKALEAERKAEQEAFRNFITSVLDSSPLSLVGTDENGVIKYWNKAATGYFGYTAEEAIDKLTPAVLHLPEEMGAEYERITAEYDADFPPGFELFKFLPYQGKVYEREWTFVRKNGEHVPGLLTVTAWKRGDGTYGGLLGVVRDLRKDKAIEAEREAQQEEFNRMIDNVPGLVYQYTYIPETGWHGFTFVSEKSREMFGYEPQEMMVSQDESPMEIHPEDAPVFEQAFAHSLENMTPFRVEIRLKPKNEDFKMVRAVSRPRPVGEHVVFDGLLLDISEEKSREEALEETRAQITQLEKDQALLERANNEGFWKWNLKTNEVTYNERFFTMLGYTSGEIGEGLQAFQRLVHSDDEEHAFQNVDQYVKGEIDKYEVRFRMHHKDGGYRVILSRGALELDEEGKPFRLLGTHADITDFVQS